MNPRALADAQAQLLTTKELTACIEECWRKVDAFKAAGNSYGHREALTKIVPLIVERQRKLRKEEKLRKAGWSEVEYSQEVSDYGRREQQCVYARCRATDERVGPIWGHGENSVKRALCTLTEQCWCGTKFHKEGEAGDE